MKYKNCIQCSNELPFSISLNPVMCPFCGTENDIAKPNARPSSSMIGSKIYSDNSSTLGGITSTISGSNCDGSGGDC